MSDALGTSASEILCGPEVPHDATYRQRLALDAEQNKRALPALPTPAYSIRICDQPGVGCHDCGEPTTIGPLGYRRGDLLCDRCFGLENPELSSILELIKSAQTSAKILGHSFATEPRAVISEQLDQLQKVCERVTSLRIQCAAAAEFDPETDAPVNALGQLHSVLSILIEEELTPALTRLQSLQRLMETDSLRGGREG